MRGLAHIRRGALAIAIMIALSSTVVLPSVSGARASTAQLAADPALRTKGIIDSPLMDQHAKSAIPWQDASSMEKLSKALKDTIQSEPMRSLRTIVYTTDPSALGIMLRRSGVPTIIGTKPSLFHGLRQLIVDMPAIVAAKAASLDSVFAISLYVVPEPPKGRNPNQIWGVSGSAPGPTPNTVFATKGHHATDAWAAGYTGDGVRVAILDSGVDFANPDLLDTWAVDKSPSSPYFGWPMAFDPNSMFLYMFQSLVYPSVESWYVDTSFNATADVNGLLPLFNGRQYNTTGIVSASGWFHLGLHPAKTLRLRYGQSPAVLVTDSKNPYNYDTVFVDLDDNGHFLDDKPTNLTNPISFADYRDATTGEYNTSSWDWGDGAPDMSGGLLYYLANGVDPIPYSDVIASRYGIPNPLQGNGDLIALMIGDQQDAGGDHGTLCASAVVAQNSTGAVQGFAPDAKIMAVGDIYYGGFWLDTYSFAAEGYDGIEKTGDEAMIGSASYGTSTTDNDGWDYESRFIDLLSSTYRSTVFVVATGNGGPGFGTVTSPSGSASVISVGASTSYYSGGKTPWEDGSTWEFGDIQPWSNRGPSALGRTDPDVVTVGAWASGDEAINRPDESSTNGTDSWTLWGGTSLATPATAGILALIYDAYYSATSTYPSDSFVRELLMNGADNIHYDPLIMGSGLSNAYRSALIAAGLQGVHVTPSMWVPGEFRNKTYPSFASIVSPGSATTSTFKITNEGTAAATVGIADKVMSKTGQWALDFWSNSSEESPPSLDRPDYLWDVTSMIPPGTELVRGILYTDYSSFDVGADYVADSYYMLMFYNWKDLNGNSRYWNDLNSNGVVNLGELDNSAGTEFMRFTFSYNLANIQNAFVHDPLSRISDGLLVGVSHFDFGVPSTLVHLVLEFYRSTDFSWMTESQSSLNIAPGATATFTSTVIVPPTEAVGAYSAMIVLSSGGNDTVIPVVINVAGSNEKIVFQSNSSNTSYYDNGHVYGGFDWSWRPESGDWRFYFMDIPDAAPISSGTRLLVHTQWTNMPTDIDTHIFGPKLDVFSSIVPAIFGPYAMEEVGASKNTNNGGGLWFFDTVTGGPEEWVSGPANKGLNEIALHNVLYAGAGPSEQFSGETGLVTVDPFPWDEQVAVNKSTRTFSFLSTMDIPAGMQVAAYGMSQPVTYSSPISNGQRVSFFTNLSNAGIMDVILTCGASADLDLYVYYEDPFIGEILVGVSASPSANEAVKLTLPMDGAYRIEVQGFFVPGAGVSFELTLDIRSGVNLVPLNMPVGPISANVTYQFDVQYTIPDMEGDYYGVIFFGPQGAVTAIEMPVRLLARDTTPPVITINSPTPGSSYRTSSVPILFASFYDVEGAFFSGVNLSRVGIMVDGRDVTSSATVLSGYLWWNLTFLMNEGLHAVELRVYDLASSPNLSSRTFLFTIDNTSPTIVLVEPGGSLTNQTVITISGYTETNIAMVYINGVPTPTVLGGFTTSTTLSEGINTITVEAADAVGNIGRLYRTIALDTIRPALVVSSPANGAILKEQSVLVTGTTEPGAALVVNGISASVSNTGGFYVRIPLMEGSNTIIISAKDAAQNTQWAVLTVTADTIAPTLSITSPTSSFSRALDVIVSGKTEPGASVTVNGNIVSVAMDGTFTTVINYVADGLKTILANATDPAGNFAFVVKTITIDTLPPMLTVNSPAPLLTVGIPSVRVSGVTEPTATLTVQGQFVRVQPSGSFDVPVALLTAGQNTITIIATDQAGNTNTVTRAVIYVQPDIPGMQQNISDLQRRIQDLLDIIDGLNTTIDHLNNNLTNTIAEVNNNITQLQNRLDQANQNLTNTQRDLNNLKGNVESLSNVLVMSMAILIVVLFVGLVGIYLALARKIDSLQTPHSDMDGIEDEHEEAEEKPTEAGFSGQNDNTVKKEPAEKNSVKEKIQDNNEPGH